MTVRDSRTQARARTPGAEDDPTSTTSEETVEIFVEADFETRAEERRRFAIINIPRHLFSEATGEAARRAANKDR